LQSSIRIWLKLSFCSGERDVQPSRRLQFLVRGFQFNDAVFQFRSIKEIVISLFARRDVADRAGDDQSIVGRQRLGRHLDGDSRPSCAGRKGLTWLPVSGPRRKKARRSIDVDLPERSGTSKAMLSRSSPVAIAE
jgi:hypothetical protein